MSEQENEFLKWMNEELDSGQIRCERVSWLVKCNGGFDVCGWGYIGYSGGAFQHGLEQNDAIELIQWKSYFDGIADFGDFDPYAIGGGYIGYSG